MVKAIRIYFEGDAALKPGLAAFFGEIGEKAAARRCSLKLIDANGTPVQDFYDGIKANPGAWNVLLLDSDETITEPLDNFCARKRLAGLTEQVFWMVQIMESWFLADPECLKKFYGPEFQENALKGNPQVEQIPKGDVLSRLNAATRATKSGKYHKTGHAPHILAALGPELVQGAAPHCKRLFDALLAKLNED